MAIPANTETGSYKNLTASGAVNANPGQLLGFYVNNTSSGVINFKDGGSAGTTVSGSITPAIGFHRFPCDFTASTGPYMTLVSGSIDVTLFYVPRP